MALRFLVSVLLFLITFFAFAASPPPRQTDYLNLRLPPQQLEDLLHRVAERPPAKELTPDLDIDFNPDDLKDPGDWKRKFFDVVVVVDKAAAVQEARVYVGGTLERKVKVSTGREKFEKADPNGDPHKPIRDTVSQTHTGYFTPTLLDIDYVSTLYEDAEMPWAVFFNLDQGEATHKAPDGAENLLGKRASGGCVRMAAADARDVFWFVRLSGGPYTQTELSHPQFEAEAKALGAKQPYDQMPEIPKFSLEGELERDQNGDLVMHKGYRALFVILNSEI